LSAWRGEVAVGDIDRDALLALGFEAVGEKRKVDNGIAATAGAFLHREELVLENAFGIVKQTADESRFAVIDGTSGGEAKKVHELDQKERRLTTEGTENTELEKI
jgi:hypothetical protein